MAIIPSSRGMCRKFREILHSIPPISLGNLPEWNAFLGQCYGYMKREYPPLGRNLFGRIFKGGGSELPAPAMRHLFKTKLPTFIL